MKDARLRLLGCIYEGPQDGMIPFLYKAFPRLQEMRPAGRVMRQVQYCAGSGDDYLHFIGLDVERIDEIPQGMMAWELSEDSWSVTSADHTWSGSLAWRWFDESNAEHPCGEFDADRPPFWKGGGRMELIASSNSYLGAPCEDDIYLVVYDPAWPQRYETMRQRLLDTLGPDVALRVEHYGSTSIPGMPAKPVIDILVEVPSLEEGRRWAIPAFNAPEIEYWLSDHIRFYIRDKTTGVRICHLHMAPAGHQLWEGIAFRDYLIAHPNEAARYSALKHELAERHRGDRPAYTNTKEAFVREVTDRALAET